MHFGQPIRLHRSVKEGFFVSLGEAPPRAALPPMAHPNYARKTDKSLGLLPNRLRIEGRLLLERQGAERRHWLPIAAGAPNQRRLPPSPCPWSTGCRQPRKPEHPRGCTGRIVGRLWIRGSTSPSGSRRGERTRNGPFIQERSPVGHQRITRCTPISGNSKKSPNGSNPSRS